MEKICITGIRLLHLRRREKQSNRPFVEMSHAKLWPPLRLLYKFTILHGFHELIRALAMSTIKMTLKLLVDKKANKVLFAEAGKDFVDFLFSLLSLPLGSVVRVLTNARMVGCTVNVYQSVEEITGTYISNKDMQLKPNVPPSAVNNPLMITKQLTPCKTDYMCGNSVVQSRRHMQQTSLGGFANASCNRALHIYITNIPNTKCPTCNSTMSMQLTNISSNVDETASNCVEAGYVKEVVTYMVTDDLVVTPMSTISSITELKNFNSANVSSVEEKVVNVGMEQVLDLLKASLQSKTALSEVFLIGK